MCMQVHCVYPCYPQESKEGARFLQTGLISGYEAPSRYWELKLGPLQK